jgi:hypothetical protein
MRSDFTRFVQQKSNCQSYQSSTRWPRWIIGAKAQGISEGYCERFVQQRGKALLWQGSFEQSAGIGWNLDGIWIVWIVWIDSRHCGHHHHHQHHQHHVHQHNNNHHHQHHQTLIDDLQ